MIFKSKGSTDLKLLKEIRFFWNKYEMKIIKEIFILTGISIKTGNIVCYLDNATNNGYYGSRTITLGVKGRITKDDALMVIVHELFHIFYWRKIKKMRITKSSPGNESKYEWNIAEATAFLLTSESSMMKYWPKANMHIYSETINVYKKVKDYWVNGEFDSFIRRAYRS